VSGYAPNNEVDQVAWLGAEKAARLLTYERDRETLAEAFAEAGHKRTATLVVLRHARARSRAHWRADDRFRPLLRTGQRQADRLAPLLAAYDITELVSSSSARCVTTLVPYADMTGRKIRAEDALSEEDATRGEVLAMVGSLLDGRRRAAICTHRPVLPAVFEAVGIDDPGLDPGEMVVVHHRKGRILALEKHAVP
jgi:8-oxo-dGTP diphosphatase